MTVEEAIVTRFHVLWQFLTGMYEKSPQKTQSEQCMDINGTSMSTKI